MKFSPLLLASLFLTVGSVQAEPLRVLFLGHAAEQHPSDKYFPILQQALGRDAIYFDYVRTPGEAFADAAYLNRFDAVLLYANHATIEPAHWENLRAFVETGGKGFVPVHCGSWCFQNIPEFDQLVGGRFKSHQTGIFRARTVKPEHGAIRDVPEFEAWDETYFHVNHNPKGRTVLQMRDARPGDPHTEPEPWTWVREQGRGRVFYTASGHDERVWNREEFHQLLRAGLLWSVGDERRKAYQEFVDNRTPLRYEKRDHIANYEKRPEPLPFQLPLSAEESMSYTRVPVGFRLELFASEPDIINPIAMAWDERGRLWVIQTIDYPNETRAGEAGDDCIKILEDTDGDGRCDKVTVFAEGLNIPTSLTFSNGGVIVQQAPDTLFLRDTDGDDKADTREVLLTGWGTNDTHAGPSNLRWGPDNWIWGTVGYSGFRPPSEGGEAFGSGVLRFRPDGSGIEFLHQFNNNTWGLGFNSSGDVFGSTANNNPTFFCGLPATVQGERVPGRSAQMIADNPRFHPITPNVRQVDAFGAYTAGAGHAFADSDAFPETWRGRRAFVAGPTGHLLGAYDMHREGAGYRAENAFSIVASADEWFSPIMAEVGPDGHLWIADWYNFIIQHNPTPNPDRGGYKAQTGTGNAHINPLRDREHGRIYRLVWEGSPNTPPPASLASSEDLVAALDHPNGFWRTTARRLLVERADPKAAELVRATGFPSVDTVSAAAALGPFPKEALTAKDPAIRRAAIRALPETKEGADLLFDTALLNDPDLLTRLAAFSKLAAFPTSERITVAAGRLASLPENSADAWLKDALKRAGGTAQNSGKFTLGPNLLPNPGFEKATPDGRPQAWKTTTYSGKALHQPVGKAFARGGGSALKITSGREQGGADASWNTQVEVKPNTDYRYSGWIRTQGIAGARGAQLNVHEIQAEGKTRALQKKNDWTEVEVTFNSGSHKRLTLNCLFGGWGKSIGTAFFDDIALQELVPAPVAATEGEPIVGDAKAGRKIFHEHEVAGCIRCHQISGAGGVVGPALDSIATRKQADYIRDSLTEPSKDLAEGFQQLGISPMPPMNLLLDEQQFEDVLAYLMTLK